MPTIGVSIAVPEPLGPALQDFRVSVGDTSARHIPTHITMVPPADVPESSLADIDEHLRAVAARHEPFRVRLRGTGTFRPVSPVVFVGVVEGIAGCELLAGSARSGPLAVEVNFPYHPHVTVAHDVPEDQLDRAFTELADFDASFEVREFWLYVHDERHGWRPTQSFALGRSAGSGPGNASGIGSGSDQVRT